MKLSSINSINVLFEPLFCFSFSLIFLVLSCFIFIGLPFHISLDTYSFLSFPFLILCYFMQLFIISQFVPQFSHSYCWRWYSTFLIYLAKKKEQLFYRFVGMFPGTVSFKGLSRTFSKRFSVLDISWKILWKNLGRIMELTTNLWMP